jgi:hypothetical protein
MRTSCQPVLLAVGEARTAGSTFDDSGRGPPITAASTSVALPLSVVSRAVVCVAPRR